MSNKALTWAFEADIDNPGAKFVLVALADHASDHAGEDWTCWPAIDRIMRFTSMPQRTVERHLSWLVNTGWITREAVRDRRGRLKTRIYRLRRDGPTPPDAVCPPAKLAGGEMVDPPAKNDASTRQFGGVHPPPVAGGYIDEPPKEPSVTLTPSARADVDEAFEALCGVYPVSGIDNTDVPAARIQFAVEVLAVGDPWRIVTAARLYRSAPETQRRSFACPSLEIWLRKQSYRGRLPPDAADAVAVVAPELFAFEGPAELRRKLCETQGESFVRKYLDPARYDPGGRAVLPANGYARDELARAWFPIKSMGYVLGDVQRGVA